MDVFHCPECTCTAFTLSDSKDRAECNNCGLEIDLNATAEPIPVPGYNCTLTDAGGNVIAEGRFVDTGPPVAVKRNPGPCPCACNSGGYCGGCGHAGCGRR